MKGTWQTTSSGGSGIGLAVIIGLVLLIVSSAGAVATAIGHAADVLLHIALITIGSLAGLGIAGAVVAVVLARRAPRKPPPWAAQVQPHRRDPQRAVQGRTAAQSGLPPQIHLHLHGPVSAADVAELIARQGNPLPAIEEEP